MEVLCKFMLARRFHFKFKKFSGIQFTDTRNYCPVTTDGVNKGVEKAAIPPAKRAETAPPHQANLHKIQSKQCEQNSLKIAVIGVPNAGKSTFINNLINHRVCPTSSKVHTTRRANKAIYTSGQTQLVFFDTPGLVTSLEIKRHHLEQNFKSAYRHAIQHADLIACMHDVSNSWTRNALHPTVLETLKEYSHFPSILILNKIDALKSKRVLLELIRILTNDSISSTQNQWKHKQNKIKIKSNASMEERSGKRERIPNKNEETKEGSWCYFQEVFLVSSLTGNGLNDIHDYLINIAKDRSWDYSKETFTDETPEELIVECVRARLLDYLPQEIPYNLQSVLEFFSEENGTLYASVEVTCPSPRIERLICGESNGKLKQITERVTSDLVETFGKRISLTIATKYKIKDKNCL